MIVKPLQTKAEYEAALKVVSVVVDAHPHPHPGTIWADRLQALDTSIETYEASEIPSMMLDSELVMTFSKRDFSTFSKLLRQNFQPNLALKAALAAKESVREV